jgi:hypothetical protein
VYRFITGFYKSKTNKVDWIEDPNQLNSEPLSLLYTKYHSVRFVVAAPSVAKLQFFPIDVLPIEMRKYQGTILDFLKENKNNTLPTLTYIEGDKVGEVKYLNYITQGYKSLAINSYKHPAANINRDEKTDALLYRDDLYRSDYDDIVKYSVSVCNGLLHRATAGDDGIHILGAGTTTRLSHIHSFGILDFSEIGEVVTLPIKKENIVHYFPGEEFRDTIHFKIPNEHAGKSVMLSIGGYLYYLGNTLSRINETLFQLETDKATLLKRIYEGEKYGLDIKSLGLTKDKHDSSILLDETERDEFYINLLTHPLSFFIILDKPNYHVEKQILENPRFPGKYLYYFLPKYPIISELGLIPNFNYRYIDDVYILHSDLLTRDNYVFTTMEYKKLKRLSFHIDPYDPRYYQQAHILKIRFSND